MYLTQPWRFRDREKSLTRREKAREAMAKVSKVRTDFNRVMRRDDGHQLAYAERR